MDFSVSVVGTCVVGTCVVGTCVVGVEVDSIHGQSVGAWDGGSFCIIQTVSLVKLQGTFFSVILYTITF